MTFEERVLRCSKERIAKLMPAAVRASEKPDTDVRIEKKSAYFVIKDCALLARTWLPLHLMTRMGMEALKAGIKGGVTRDEIADFVKRAGSGDFAAAAMLDVLVRRMGISDSGVVTYEDHGGDDDVYGDYGRDGATASKAVTTAPSDSLADLIYAYFAG